MKKLYVGWLLVCCLVFNICKSQYVAIPDAAFATWLQTNGYAACMSGSQLDTACAAVLSATTMNCTGVGIKNLQGVQYFKNLDSLNCSYDSITSIPALPHALIKLSCQVNFLDSLPSLPATLLIMNCDSNTLSQMRALPVLMQQLRMNHNKVTGLPALPSSLLYLDCGYNKLTQLPALPQLSRLICDSNHIGILPALSASLLYLSCNYDSLISLPDLPQNLVYISCNNNHLGSIPDLPAVLPYFDCSNNPGLYCLPELKTINFLNFSNTGVTCLPDYGIVTNSNPFLGSLPLCGIFNTNGCQVFGSISGQCFYDANNNCLFDSTDAGMNYVKTQLYSNGVLLQQAFTGGQGAYSFNDTNNGNYTIQLDTSNIPFIISCGDSANRSVTLSAADSFISNKNFAFACPTQGYDLGVQSIVNNSVVPAPGATITLNTIAGDMSQLFGAHCAAGVNGQVQITYSGPISYTGPAPGAINPSSVSGNTIKWTIANFGTVNDAGAFNLIFKINNNATPGAQACFTVSVTPSQGDFNPANNTATFCFTIVPSLPAMEKEAYPANKIASAGSWLTYTIRFRNTGNGAVQNITITDTLSADLNPSTFQLLAYSAANVTQVSGNRVVFYFPNINLPDSAANDSAYRGYVQYKIETLDTLSAGTIIKNTAAIVFNQSAAVNTNTTADTLCHVTYGTVAQTIHCGDSVTFGGHVYHYSGAYFDTLLNALGCDSIASLQLTVSGDTINMAKELCPGDSVTIFGETFQPGVYHVLLGGQSACDTLLNLAVIAYDTIPITYLNDTICYGEPVLFNGRELDSSGTYTANLNSQHGCDSTVILKLVVQHIQVSSSATICAGDSFSFLGRELRSSGTYDSLFVHPGACDTLKSIVLTVDSIPNTYIYDTICFGEGVSFNGHTYDSTGVYAAHYSGHNGCDSMVILELYAPLTKITDTVIICAGKYYSFYGRQINRAGTYDTLVIHQNACDTMVTLQLIVDSLTPTYVYDTICKGESFLFNGSHLDSSGIYSEQLLSQIGCDSTVILSLNVHVNQKNINATICAGDSFNFFGREIRSSGNYDTLMVHAGGCDTLINVILVVSDSLLTNVYDTICKGESVSFNGNNLDSSGTYTGRFTSQLGCDSTVILKLQVNLAKITDTFTICAGAIYMFYGKPVYMQGTYDTLLVHQNACDTLFTLYLKLDTLPPVFVYDTICKGESFLFNGNELDTSGTYTAHLTSSAHCDSTVILGLYVQLTRITHSTTLCSGDSAFFYGKEIHLAGTYDTLVATLNGCDTLHSLILTVADSVPSTYIFDTICQGESVLFNGRQRDSTGSYAVHYTSVFGCDSAVILKLQVNLFQIADTFTICAGNTYIFFGKTLYMQGTYDTLLVSQNACDTLITLYLKIDTLPPVYIYDTICQGESFLFNGSELNASGTYTAHLLSSAHCDSTVILGLNVHLVQIPHSATLCAGDSVYFYGKEIHSAGTYDTMIVTPNGCDTVHILSLTVSDSVPNTYIFDTICKGESILFNGSQRDSSGTYTVHYTSMFGCDSAVVLKLSVQLTQVNLSLTICAGDTYVFFGKKVYASGTYDSLVTHQNACDTLFILDLTTLNSLPTTYLYDTICQGESILFNGSQRDSSGSYAEGFITASGCDSIVILELDVRLTRVNLSSSLCYGDSLNFYGRRLKHSGTYDTLVVHTGACDTMFALTVVVTDSAPTHIFDTLCVGESILFNGIERDSSGVYTAIFTTGSGCDSTVILNLTFNLIQTSTTASICSNDSIYFYGKYIHASGTYDTLVIHQNTCDTLAKLTLTVSDTVVNHIYDTICTGESVLFNGVQRVATGIYTATFTTHSGCDSTVILNLTVNLTQNITTTSICSGDSIRFFGHYIHASGAYDSLVMHLNACDTMYILNLTVLNPIATTTIHDTICQGESVLFNGIERDSSGTYTATFTTQAGCDSTVVLTLVVHLTQLSFNAHICQGQNFSFGGRALNQSGTYDSLVVHQNGCDTAVVLTLAVNDSSPATHIYDTICQGENIILNGNSFNSSGSYLVEYANQAGCDSLIIFNLTVKLAQVSSSSVLCYGDSLAFYGRHLKHSGVYDTLITHQNACDTLYALTITVTDSAPTVLYDTICQGESVTLNGISHNATGTYTANFTTHAGCDSIVTLNLTVNLTQNNTTTSICQGDSIKFVGRYIHTSGTYDSLVTHVNACDTMYTLNLTVSNTITNHLYDTICQGESVLFNGISRDSTGAYTANYTTHSGCDSTVILNLTVKLTQNNTTTSICSGDSIKFFGRYIHASGTYDSLVTHVNACDTMYALNLTVLNPIATTIHDTICQGESVLFNGISRDSSGTYIAHYTTQAGCDSMVSLVLFVRSTVINTSATICQGQSYNFNGRVINQQGIYDTLMVHQNGCDTTFMLTLVVNDSSPATHIFDTISPGQSVILNGNSFDSSGTYLVHYSNHAGCDSLVILSLTIKLSAVNESFTLCYGDSLNFYGRYIHHSGIYDTLITHQNAGDTSFTLTVTVTDSAPTVLYDTICQGESVTLNGISHNATGTYTANFTTHAGCDSIVTLNLTVNLTQNNTTTSICQGDSIKFVGRYIHTSGTYDSLVTHVNACDTMYTLNLTVSNTVTNHLYDTICQGESVLFNGISRDSTGVYTANYTTHSGCDSTVILNLTVKLTQNNTTTSICSGDSIKFFGRYIHASGTYDSLVTHVNACDTMYALNLTVLNPIATTIHDTICQGESVLFNGISRDSSGTYIAHYTTQAGCDSMVSLVLFVRSTVINTSATICQGQSYNFNGRVINQQGIYDTLMVHQNGCDTTFMLTLVVSDSSPTTIIHDTICQGESITLNGNAFDSSGTYLVHYTNHAGCDSLVILNLTVKLIQISNSIALCYGDSLAFYGRHLKHSGVYDTLITHQNACDTSFTFTVTVTDSAPTVLYDTICQGESVTLNGISHNATGTYTANFTTHAGCDSIVTLNLTVNLTQNNTTTSICQGDSIKFVGRYIHTSGTYDSLVTHVNACDTMYTLNLTVSNTITNYLYDTICRGESVLFNGISRDSTGVYTANYTTHSGCDSTVILNLIVQLSQNTTATSICSGDSIKFFGRYIHTSGTYDSLVTHVNACDTMYALNLTVLNPIATTIHDTICQGENVLFNGSERDSSGTYIAHYTTQAGCDSMVSLVLFVRSTVINTSATICQGQSYNFNGRVINQQGIYDTLMVHQNGCDTTFMLTLVVSDSSPATIIHDTICQGESIILNGNAFDSSGTYLVHYTNHAGCDSLVILNLTVKLTEISASFNLCYGDSLGFVGRYVHHSGIYDSLVVHQNACDTLYSLTVMVTDSAPTVLYDTICQGESVTLNGISHNATGTYTANFTTHAGCDSIVTLNLTVNLTQNNTTTSICQGDSIKFVGRYIHTSGTYDSLVTHVNACDTMYTLNLTVSNTVTNHLYDTICQGESVLFNGISRDSTGVYTANYTTHSGCDSTVILNLTVKLTQNNTTTSICSGDSIKFLGRYIHASGTYDSLVTHVNACDTMYALNLTVLNPIATTIHDTICQGESVLFNGISRDSSGTYIAHYTTQAGCDSMVSLVLFVRSTVINTSATICQGQSYNFNGRVINQQGIYDTLMVHQNGCDTTFMLTLVVSDSSPTTTIHDTICQGESIILNGNAFDSSGTYLVHYTNHAGCDSLVILNLTVKLIQISNSIALCYGDSLAFYGRHLKHSGVYDTLITHQNACDTSFTFTVTVTDSAPTVLYDTICQGESVTLNGISHNATGTYTANFTTHAGCDSIVTLNLTVNLTQNNTTTSICQGDSIKFVGRYIHTSGTYDSLVTHVNACDTMYTLNLTVGNTITNYLYDTICRGESVLFNGISRDSTGVYTANYTTHSGCDSTVILNLIVQLAQNTTATSICSGDSIKFFGRYIHTSGTYDSLVTHVNACDTMYALNLTVLNPIATTIHDTICQGENVLFNGSERDSSGTYIAHYTTQAGCDSMVSLVLFVRSTVINTSATICQGQSYNFDGRVINQQGIYDTLMVHQNGCDTTFMLTLVVNDSSPATIIHDTICQGESITLNGNAFDSSGTYLVHYSNHAGCDSLVILNLNVHLMQISTSSTICAGDTFNFFGRKLYQSGIYDTLSNHPGACDTFITFHLTVDTVPVTYIYDTICAGESILFNGNLLYDSGTYTAHLVSHLGCDSVVTLQLTVQTKQITIDEYFCNNDSVYFYGRYLRFEGAYDTLITHIGACDTLVTLNIYVNKPLPITYIYDTVCTGDSIFFNGSYADTSGSYTEQFISQFGCDSTVTLQLNVRAFVPLSLRASICVGDSFKFYGHYLHAQGTYDTLIAVHDACDTLVTLNLLVMGPASPVYIYDTICRGDSVAFNGGFESVTGVYFAHLTTHGGCDSTAILNLHIRNFIEVPLTASICAGDSFNFFGTYIREAGTYDTVIKANSGCDTAASLTLTVKQPSTTNLFDTICQGESIAFNGHELITSGTYTAQYACDSNVILNLNVKPAPEVSFSWDSLFREGALQLYLLSGHSDTTWCYNYTSPPILLFKGGIPLGGTYAGNGVFGGSLYADSINGLNAANYVIDTITYTVHTNGCNSSATDKLLVELCTGISDINLEASILLYPNPTADKLIVQSALFTTAYVTPVLCDITGKEIASMGFTRHLDEFIFNTGNLAAGLYYIKLNINGTIVVKKFVKIDY